jgi:hypothetical protein
MKTITKVLAVLAFAGWVSTSHAIPIVTTAACVNDGGSLCATGITNLVIGGDLLDVSFSQLSYDDLFASSDPYFLGDKSGADDAREAMFGALNAAGAPSVIAIPGTSGSASVFTPYQLNGATDVFVTVAARTPSSPLWGASGDGTIPRNAPLSGDPNSVFTYATFTLGVPIPTTLALFGLGLAGIGWTRRKKA